MAVKNRNRLDHYVRQGYLEGFIGPSGNGQLSVFDKQKGSLFESGTPGVGAVLALADPVLLDLLPSLWAQTVQWYSCRPRLTFPPWFTDRRPFPVLWPRLFSMVTVQLRTCRLSNRLWEAKERGSPSMWSR